LLIAGVVPHLCKYLVCRERPNRALARRFDTRVARLGDTWDSFPSGHAVHLSAIAGSARRLVPRRWWPTLIGALAASRVVLLAHLRATLLPAGASARSSIRRSAPPSKWRRAPRQRRQRQRRRCSRIK
jgi:hypothetical protein